jgi:hypothetical protein
MYTCPDTAIDMCPHTALYVGSMSVCVLIRIYRSMRTHIQWYEDTYTAEPY